LYKYFLLFFLAFSATVALAHPEGHDGPQLVARCEDMKHCTQPEIKVAAAMVFKSVAMGGQVPSSWEKVGEGGQLKAVKSNGRSFWLTTYENPEEKDVARNKLYIIISENGFLEGLNFSKPDFDEETSPSKMWGLAIIAGLSLLTYFLFLRKKKVPA
jgi:hypothetical protein